MATDSARREVRPSVNPHRRQRGISSDRRPYLPEESREGYDHRVEHEMLAGVPAPLLRADGYLFCQAPECSKHRGFANRSNYLRHIKSAPIHATGDGRKCPVPDCGASFARSDDLLRHQRVAHGLEPPLGKPGRRLKTFAKAVVHQLATSAHNEGQNYTVNPNDQPWSYTTSSDYYPRPYTTNSEDIMRQEQQLEESREPFSSSTTEAYEAPNLRWIESPDVPEPIERGIHMFCPAPECSASKGFHNRATYIRHYKTAKIHQADTGLAARHTCVVPGCVSSFSRADQLLRHQVTIHHWDPRLDQTVPSGMPEAKPIRPIDPPLRGRGRRRQPSPQARADPSSNSNSQPRHQQPVPEAGSSSSETSDPESTDHPVLYHMETPPGIRPEEPREYAPKPRGRPPKPSERAPKPSERVPKSRKDGFKEPGEYVPKRRLYRSASPESEEDVPKSSEDVPREPREYVPKSRLYRSASPESEDE